MKENMNHELTKEDYEIRKETQWGNNFILVVSDKSHNIDIKTNTQWGCNVVIDVKINNLEEANEIGVKLAHDIAEILRTGMPLGSKSDKPRVSELLASGISLRDIKDEDTLQSSESNFREYPVNFFKRLLRLGIKNNTPKEETKQITF